MLFSPDINISLSNEIGLDLETNGLKPWENDILVVSITTDKETYVFETNKYTKEELTNLFLRISNECDVVIGHNIKFDCGFIYYHHNVLLNNVWDTLLASQIVNAGKPKSEVEHNLPACLHRFLGITVEEHKEKSYYQMSFVGLKPAAKLNKKQLKYAGEDTKPLIDLYHTQLRWVNELGLSNIAQLENTLLPVLTTIEVKGCKVDKFSWKDVIYGVWYEQRDEYERKLDEELIRLSQEYPTLSGRYTRERKKQVLLALDLFGQHKEVSNENLGNVNYSSSDQILGIFELINEPIPAKLKKKGEKHNKKILEEDTAIPSVDEGVLKTYLTEYPKTPLRPFIKLLLKLREYEKLISTYGEEFLGKLDINSFIHTEYSQCFTDTGRLASRNPNLQNIPSTKLEVDGYDLRRFFIPDSGEYTFITCDMDGAEVRVAAEFSRDPALVNSLIKGEDLHSKLASTSFSIIFGEPTTVSKKDKPEMFAGVEYTPEDLRQDHKSVLFAKFYKGGAKRIYEILAEYINRFHEDAMRIAKKISVAIDKELPMLSTYLSNLIETAQEEGMLRANKLGRLRWFSPDVYGEAANFPIQGTNADAMKIALINVYRYLEETGYGRIVLTVHDEVVCCVRKDVAGEAADNIQRIMTESLGWFLELIPGKASRSILDYWKK